MKSYFWKKIIVIVLCSVLIFSFFASFSTFIVVTALGSPFEENEYTKSYIDSYGAFTGSFIPFFTIMGVIASLIVIRFYFEKNETGKIRLIILSIVDAIAFGFLIQRFLNFLNDFSLLMVVLDLSSSTIPISMIVQYFAFTIACLIFAPISYNIMSGSKN